MADNFSADFGGLFKEAVCIDTGRVYDSCSDKDCISDLRVLFPEAIQRSVVDVATSAKVKSVKVIDVSVDVEPVPFNKGFYSVNMTYYFEVTAEVSTAQSPSNTVVGVATSEKKAILFGSEGNVRTFTSRGSGEILENSDMPLAKVQVVDPICLKSELVSCAEVTSAVKIPDCIAKYFKTSCFGRCTDYTIDSSEPRRDLFVTLGLFSIIQLERQVQMLIPCYDFCIPDKDCSVREGQDSPCDIFSQISFPTEQFFPPKLEEEETGCCRC